MPSTRHHVVIIGAGFGGLAAAKAMARLPVDITIVDARNHHTFQPLLYQVATAGLDAGDVCYAVRGVFQRQRNARVRLGRVTGVDTTTKRLTFDDGETELAYDSLILACGAVTATFGIPGVDEHALGLKSAADALEVRDHVLGSFERAAASPSQIEEGVLTFVIAGGGPTGVELAGGMAELIHNVLRRDFPSLDVDRARVVLVEAADRVLGTFSTASSTKARRALERMGVEVRTSTAVARVHSTEVVLADGHTIPAHTMVWAAGVRAHPLGEQSGFPVARGGRIVVDERLAVPGHDDVHAIGDLAATLGPDGAPLPQVAPVAIQGGRHVAEVLAARLRDEAPPEPFLYVDKGSMATIGRHAAVAELPSGRRLSGPIGWAAWLGLHLIMLIGFRNRANVLVNWAWNYLTYDRGNRVIVDRSS